MIDRASGENTGNGNLQASRNVTRAHRPVGAWCGGRKRTCHAGVRSTKTDLPRPSVKPEDGCAASAGCSEMPPGEFTTGAGLEVFLEGTSLGCVTECDCHVDSPWSELSRMRDVAAVVVFEALFEVDGAAGVGLCRIDLTDQTIDIGKGGHASRSPGARFPLARLRAPRFARNDYGAQPTPSAPLRA